MKSHTIEDLITNREMLERKERLYRLTNEGDECYYFFRNKYLSDMFFKNRNNYFLNCSECPICLDKIYNLQSSWITMCGHLFHKKCLQRWLYKTQCKTDCPICRGMMGSLEYLDGIKYSVYPVYNFLDLLEESENIFHKFCYECDNILGFGTDCRECQDFFLIR